MKQKLSKNSLVGYLMPDNDTCVCAYCWHENTENQWGGYVVEISKDFAPVADMIYHNFVQWCYECDTDIKYWEPIQKGGK